MAMKMAAPVPRSAARTAEVRGLFDHAGPFLSVYMGLEPNVANAARVSQRRWRALRGALQLDALTERACGLVDALVPTAHVHGSSLAMIATGEEVLHVEYELEVARDVVRWGSLPSV